MAIFLGHTVYITLRFYEQNIKNLNKISLCKSSKLVVTFVILGCKVISNFTQVQFVCKCLMGVQYCQRIKPLVCHGRS